MTRKKVKLVWIVNDTARKASLKKRRVGLLKKVSELTTLCGVDAFVIIYSPDDPEPAVWPSRPVVQQLLVRFQSMPDMERCKKMMNQESYLKERMGKINEQSKKHTRKNREMEMAGLMHQIYEDKGFDRLDISQLYGLGWLVEEKIKEIRKRIEYFQQIPPLQPGSFLTRRFPTREPNSEDGDDDGNGGEFGGESTLGGELGGGNEAGDGKTNQTDGGHGISWDQWFTDIMNNPDHNVAGGSSTKNDLGLPNPFKITAGGSSGGGDDILGFHHGYNDGGGSSASDIFGLGLPHSRNMGAGSGGNYNFDHLGLPHDNDFMRGRSGGNNFDLGLPHTNNMTAGGNNIGGTSFDPWLPRGYNPGGSNNSAGINFDLGLPHGNIEGSSASGNYFDLWLAHANNAAGNNFDPWLARGDIAGSNLGLGLNADNNFAGGTSENPFHGLGQHRRGNSGGGASSAAGGSDLGLPGYFGGLNDMGLLFDPSKNWPNNNFNP